MKPRTFCGFAGITAAAVAAAAVAVSSQSDTISLTAGTEPAFPKLEKAVNDVAKIEIKNAKGAFSITRDGKNWGMDQKEGYSVEFEKVKSAIVNLSQFKLIEKKTSDPERYERLEVDTPNSAEAKGRVVTLKNDKGDALASAVIGKLNPNLSDRAAPARTLGAATRKKPGWRVDRSNWEGSRTTGCPGRSLITARKR